jgi:AcrR family transcriptional regulator
MPMKPLSGAQLRQPTRRALAKQRTREKILASAKDLFTEKGYERATIRDIASAAGMSTGAVFASFSDKSELFREILGERVDLLQERMTAAATGKGVEAQLVNLFDAGFAFSLDDLPLFQAALSVSWSPEYGAELRREINRKVLIDVVANVLNQGVASRELDRDTDVDLLATMLWDLHIANFKLVAFEGWTGDQVRQRNADQIRLMLTGARQARAA